LRDKKEKVSGFRWWKEVQESEEGKKKIERGEEKQEIWRTARYSLDKRRRRADMGKTKDQKDNDRW